MKKSLLLLAGALLIGGPAMAAPAKTGNKFFFSAGLKAGYGTMKSADGISIKSRGFGVYGLDSDLGFAFGGLKIGAGIDYGLWRQMKDPAQLGNSNTQGKGFSWGPMLGYNFGSFELQGRYYLGSSYSLDRANQSGQKVAFLGPESAYAFQLRFPIGSGAPYVGIEYKAITYKKSEVAAREYDLAAGAKAKTSAFSAMFGVSY